MVEERSKCIIAGITGHICDSCISQAHLIVKKKEDKVKEIANFKTFTQKK